MDASNVTTGPATQSAPARLPDREAEIDRPAHGPEHGAAEERALVLYADPRAVLLAAGREARSASATPNLRVHNATLAPPAAPPPRTEHAISSPHSQVRGIGSPILHS